jgi:hypothetical protein
MARRAPELADHSGMQVYARTDARARVRSRRLVGERRRWSAASHYQGLSVSVSVAGYPYSEDRYPCSDSQYPVVSPHAARTADSLAPLYNWSIIGL